MTWNKHLENKTLPQLNIIQLLFKSIPLFSATNQHYGSAEAVWWMNHLRIWQWNLLLQWLCLFWWFCSTHKNHEECRVLLMKGCLKELCRYIYIYGNLSLLISLIYALLEILAVTSKWRMQISKFIESTWFVAHSLKPCEKAKMPGNDNNE